MNFYLEDKSIMIITKDIEKIKEKPKSYIPLQKIRKSYKNSYKTPFGVVKNKKV